MKFNRSFLCIIMLILALILTACSDEKEKEDNHIKKDNLDASESAEKEVEGTIEIEKNEDGTELNKGESKLVTGKEEVSGDAKGTVEEGGYIKYRSAEWEGNYDNNGLVFNIHSVSVTNDLAAALNYPELIANKRAVSFWFEVKNTTKDKRYNVYPVQATLVTSTGEQVEAVPLLSSLELDGKIFEGVTKNGDVVFQLNKTDDVASITKVKFVFDAFMEDNSGRQTFEVDIKLK